MKRVLSVLILAVTVAAPVSAAPMSFYAFLNGANESPVNNSPGTGVTVVTIDRSPTRCRWPSVSPA